jgi:hypothetical protein
MITALMLDREVSVGNDGSDGGAVEAPGKPGNLISIAAWDSVIRPRALATMNDGQYVASVIKPIAAYARADDASFDADGTRSDDAANAATQQLAPIVGAALQDPQTRQNLQAALLQNYSDDPKTQNLINQIFTVADRPFTAIKVVQGAGDDVTVLTPSADEAQRAAVVAAQPIQMPIPSPTAGTNGNDGSGADAGSSGDDEIPGLSSGEEVGLVVGGTALAGYLGYRSVKKAVLKRATVRNTSEGIFEQALKERGITEAPESTPAPRRSVWDRLLGRKEEVKPAGAAAAVPNAGEAAEHPTDTRSEAEQAARDAHAKTLSELRAARAAARAPAAGAPVNNISININNGNTTPAATVETGPQILGPDGRPARDYQSSGSGPRQVHVDPPRAEPQAEPHAAQPTTPSGRPLSREAQAHLAQQAKQTRAFTEAAVPPRTPGAGTGTPSHGTGTVNPTANSGQHAAPHAEIHTTLPPAPPVEPVGWWGRIKAGYEGVKTYVRGTSELKLPSNRVGSVATKVGAVGLAATGIAIADDIQRGNTGAAVRDAAVAGVGIALVKKIPVVGAPLGMLSAGSDAVDDFKKGNNARGWLDVAEAGLYTTAAVTGTAAAFNFWNPAGWGAGAIALTTGTAAGAITVGKQVYNSKDTIAGWFGYGPKADKPATVNNAGAKPGEHPHALQPSNGHDEAKKFSLRAAAFGAIPGIVMLNPVIAVAGAVTLGTAGGVYGHSKDVKIATAAQKPVAAIVGGQNPGGSTSVAGIGGKTPAGVSPDGKEVLPGQAAGADEPEGPIEKMLKGLMKLLVWIIGEKNAKALGIDVDGLQTSSTAPGKPVAAAGGGPGTTAAATNLTGVPAAVGSLAETQALAGILAKPGHEAQNQQLEAIMTRGYKRAPSNSSLEDGYLAFSRLADSAKAGDTKAAGQMPAQMLALMQQDPQLARELNQSIIPGLRSEYHAQFGQQPGTKPVAVVASGGTTTTPLAAGQKGIVVVAPETPPDVSVVSLPPSRLNGMSTTQLDGADARRDRQAQVRVSTADRGGAHVYTLGEWWSKTWGNVGKPPTAAQINQTPPGIVRDVMTAAAIQDGRMTDPNAASGLSQRGYRNGLPPRTFDGQQSLASGSGDTAVAAGQLQTRRLQVVPADHL